MSDLNINPKRVVCATRRKKCNWIIAHQQRFQEKITVTYDLEKTHSCASPRTDKLHRNYFLKCPQYRSDFSRKKNLRLASFVFGLPYDLECRRHTSQCIHVYGHACTSVHCTVHTRVMFTCWLNGECESDGARPCVCMDAHRNGDCGLPNERMALLIFL